MLIHGCSFFLKKHVKYLVRLKQCPIFASHTSTHYFHYHDTARFFSYFRAVFFWDNTNNSYICANLFILSNSFMFFRLGFPFYPSGFLLPKIAKNDPYFTDYFCLNKKIPHEISIKSLVRSFFLPKIAKNWQIFSISLRSVNNNI